METNISGIIKYFHDCYRSDNRELVIYDFLDNKIEDKVYYEGSEELVNGSLPMVHINSDKASKMLKKLEVFQKEKELLYGTFFVCGAYLDPKGDTKRLCSPLFYYPAAIHLDDEVHYLSIKADERRINYPLLNLLSEESAENLLHDPLFESLPKDYIGFEDLGSLVKLCNKYFPDMATENLYLYPENAGLKSLKKSIAQLDQGSLSTTAIIPSGIVGIVDKSSNTRGVLNELTELHQQGQFSAPLTQLFSNSTNIQPNHFHPGVLPMILSEAQQALVKSSSQNTHTLIVGPPGTGKSYTIGAIALEHMSKGQSVLIASRTDEAVDVIVKKIREQLGNDKCVVRGGKRREYKTPLNRFLAALLGRVHPLKYLAKEFGLNPKLSLQTINEELLKLNDSVKKRKATIHELERLFDEEVGNELKWGQHISQEKDGLWNHLKTQYLKIRNALQTPVWEYCSELFEEDQEQIKEVGQLIKYRYINQLMYAINNQWQELNRFHEALKLTSDTEKMQWFEQINFKIILKAFPIWLTNLSEIKEVLPFQKEMFDVAIIDEATQCDIASCLPIIQRAKRVVFAGDPNQLRHISFLSRGIQNLLRGKHQLAQVDIGKLNYRDKSILDLVMSSLKTGDQIATLDEHFRSITPIIAFSNKKFYDESLKVMTTRPDENEQGLYFIQCQGKRSKNGENIKEANRLIKDLRVVVDSEKKLNHAYCTSVGVLSPFRAQVDLLSKLVMEEFSIMEIQKHEIRVGTAYSFQGEERDHMYLSMCLDPESHHSAMNHLNKADVFNVAITRARQKQFIYLSVEASDMKSSDLLHAYLTDQGQNDEQAESENAHDQFLTEAIETMKYWGVESFWPAYMVAGFSIDLLIKHNDHYLGIDLIGYPGNFEDAFGIERYRILQRAGIKIFPLPYSDWVFEKDTTKEKLREFVFQ